MKGRPPLYDHIRSGSATDSQVEERARKEMRKRHEQEYRDTPEKDWPALMKKHTDERDKEDETK